MFRKYASLQVLEAWRVPAQAGPNGITKAAHRVAFDYEPRPGYLYVRSRMISSRTNDNHDTFPAAEIEAGYKTFLGKPVFVNHHNSNHRRARGVIVAVALHRDRNPDGTPDTWVEGLMEVDAVRFPKLAKAILAGKVNRTSMGVDVEWSRCSACGNKATSPAEYCSHLPAMKGKKIRKRNQATGKIEEKLIHEVCAGLSFFENSLLVEEPADPTAYFVGQIDARGLGKSASKTASISEPDFRDHIGNQCIDCGEPVHYARGLANKGRYPWKHHSPREHDHDAWPSDPDDKRGAQTHTYGGTDCLMCHEPVQINLGALDINGGWHHHDGMKRDHPAIPADAQAVYDAIPGIKAAKEQARQSMGDHLHRQFEQLNGGPLPRRPRGDEDQMPPDPFTASKTAAPKKEGGDHPFFHANPVSKDNIVGAYHGATDDEKALGDRWYSDAHHVAKAIAGGDAAKGAGLLSAYSPRTAWPVNLFNASRAAQGDPPGPGSGAMGMHQKPAMQILAGKHWKHVLRQPKTAAFAHLIEHGGDTPEDEKAGTHKVVIDRHAMSVAMGRRISDDDDAPLGQHQHYEHVAQLYRDAAHDLSKALGRKISPHQVQATTWLHQIRKNNEDDASLTGKPAAAAKGRATRTQNAREHWRKHHPEAHPGGIAEENMHYHGKREAAWRAFPRECVNCHTSFTEPVRPGSDRIPYGNQRASNPPFLCNDCASGVTSSTSIQHDKNPIGFPMDDIGSEMRSRRLMNEVGEGQVRNYRGEDMLPSSLSMIRQAYGETRVPPQVDTLRMEECPVCGEHDVWSGERCPVCGFVVPPSLFRDPDTSKAQDVRDQLDQAGEVTTPGDGMEPNQPGTGPDGQIGSGEDADDQLMHPDQVAPDGVPTVQGEGGPVPAADTDGQPPEDEDDEEDEEGEEPVPGQEPEDDSIDPGQQGQEEQAEGEQLQEQGEEELQQGQEEIAEGQELEQQGEEDELQPQEPEDDLECPACGSRFAIDAAAQPGMPCPACGMASLVPLEEMEAGGGPGIPGEEPEDGEEPGEDAEDPDGPPEGTEDPSESEEEDEGEDKMAGSKTGAALQQAQARRMAALAAENEALREQLRFLAHAAGVGQELAQIHANVMRRHADILNPASPVPDPPEAPPTMTTQDALMSGGKNPAGQGGTWPRGTGHTTDDPSRPGSVPGGNTNIPAQQTTTAITPGIEMPTPPATQLIDVTAPTQGTNPSQDGGVPLEQRRIETDVRIDPNPLKAEGPGIGGVGNSGAAFPWILDAQQGGQQGGQQPNQGSQTRAASRSEDDYAARVYASMRLAKLRVQAGLAQGDELAVAERIERDAALSVPMIEHEIVTLQQVGRSGQLQAARPVQRTAARQAPSLASVGAMAQYAPAVMDDGDDAALFY